MYADDTSLYFNISQNIEQKAPNAEVVKLWEWLDAHKLLLNIAKTQYMVFHTISRNVIYIPILKVIITILIGLPCLIFWGVVLHSHMTWNKHINHISMKIGRFIGMLYRLGNFCPESVLFTITLILSHFHYCLLLGGGGSVIKEKHFCTCSKGKI